MEGGIFKSKHRHDKTKPISAGKKYMASSTIKTDHHDISEILLKVALNTIALP
jgi:hypothetical protein